LYTVTSKNLLLKSSLFLFINTNSEADYYIICYHTSNRYWRKQHGILSKIWNRLLLFSARSYMRQQRQLPRSKFVASEKI